jgi:HlyD family secretion protein
MIHLRMALLTILGVLVACDNEQSARRFVGYVEADWLYVSAPQAGWIVESRLRAGDSVSKDEVLFKLDDERQLAMLQEAPGRAQQAEALARDVSLGARPAEIRALQAQLDKAQATLDRAKAERDRVQPLVQKNIESQARGDQVQAEYKVALAALNMAQENIKIAQLAGRDDARAAAQSAADSATATRAVAQWNLSQRTITARVPAKVEEVFYRTGEFVGAGSPVLAMLPGGALKVRFFVPQSVLTSMNVGQQVTVTADGLESPETARIAFIGDTAEFTPPVIYSTESRKKLVFLIEATLQANTALKPGLPVDISL